MFYQPLKFNPQKSVILETDFCADVDDVGALSLLLAGARQYGFGVSGVSVNCVRPESAAAVSAVLASRGMPQVPLGLAKQFGPDESPYLALLARRLSPEASGSLAPLADDEFYRRILEDADDQSLVVISIGFFNVLDRIWRLLPELFERKVETVIAMAGSFYFRPGYHEFNVAHAYPEEATDFINHYPGRLIFSGFEIGWDTITDLAPKAGDADSVTEAYQAYNAAGQGTTPSWKRQSWDPLTVDFAIHGEGARYRLAPNSAIRLVEGVMEFCENPAANRSFVIQNQDSQTLGQYISEAVLKSIP